LVCFHNSPLRAVIVACFFSIPWLVTTTSSWAEVFPPLPAHKPHNDQAAPKQTSKQTKALFYIPSKPTPPPTNAPLSVLKQALSIDAKTETSTYDTRQVEKNIARYKKVFSYQRNGEFKKADKAIEGLENQSLRGHILLHRYMHPTAYQASFNELAGWLQQYSDHPTAIRIYNLAQKRAPRDARYTLPKPKTQNYLQGSFHDSQKQHTAFTPIAYKRTHAQKTAYKSLISTVTKHISNGFPTGAKSALDNATVTSVMSQSETDVLATNIALSYLIEGKDQDAFSIASVVADRYGTEIPLSSWVSGISAWKQKRYALAGQYFQKAARSKYSDRWMGSASAYWSARVFARLKNKDKTLHWIKETALYPRTFYGLLAVKTLKISEEFDWSKPAFTQKHQDHILSIPRGERAFYLANIGLKNLATLELEAIDPNGAPERKDALLAMAHHYELSRFLFKFGNAFVKDNGRSYDSALYPHVTKWRTTERKTIDAALTHALVRQESRFKANALSGGGAIGLMQILPSTAAYIMKDKSLASTNRWKLKIPDVNIQIGEKYIQSLLNQGNVDNNLFSLLIAYNAGPGKLARWKEKIGVHDDPLLFIELLPSSETRAFVEHVMMNLWIYREQFDQASPSLHAIINDDWPLYRALDE